MTPELAAALAALRRAVEVEGPRPEVHRQVMARTRRDWPELMNAVDRVLNLS